MVWTEPKTITDGEQWKASDYNKYVRDNLLASETAVATTPGQMIITRGDNALAAATVHTKSDPGRILNTNFTSKFIYTGMNIKDIRSYGTMFIVVSAELVAAYLSFKVFNEKGTVIGPDTHWAATSGMYNTAPQRFTYTVDTDDSMYDIQLWGRKNDSSGTSETGEAKNVRLVVIAK